MSSDEARKSSGWYGKVVSWPVVFVILAIGAVMIFMATTKLSLAWLGTIGTVVATAGTMLLVFRFLRG